MIGKVLIAIALVSVTTAVRRRNSRIAIAAGEAENQVLGCWLSMMVKEKG